MTPGQKWYSEVRRDPRWQKRRLEIMERDGWRCQHCGAKDKTLNVHHKGYAKGLMPWDYAGFCLVTLCEDCHGAEPESLALVLDQLKYLTFRFSSAELLRLLVAMNCADRSLSGKQVVDLIVAALPIEEEAAQAAARAA